MLTRFGISLDKRLLERFDRRIREKGYANRSEAIRDLIRDDLVRKEWEDETGEKMGTVTLIYNHHNHELGDRLTHLQHDHHHNIISTMHIHLNHDMCMEVLAVRGQGRVIRKLANELISMKGVIHGRWVGTTIGQDLK